VEKIRALPLGEERVHLCYRFLHDIDRSILPIRSAHEAEDLTCFLVEMLAWDKASHAAVRFLIHHPHPVAAPALLALADTTSLGYLRNQALEALVSLRDERALDLLLDDLAQPSERGHPRTIPLLGQLGDPRALPAIERIANHPHLEREYLHIHKADTTSLSVRDEQHARGMIRRNAARDQKAARQAARLLRSARDGFPIICAFDLDEFALDKLTDNGFLIRSQAANEMYEFYSHEYPFVTADVVFHTFMILVRACIYELETLVLMPRAGDFVCAMVAACLEQAADAPSQEVADRAYANAAFFAVPAILVGERDPGTFDLPRRWQGVVEEVVQRIRQHERVAESLLFDYKDDYTQYKPRGIYSGHPELTGYFQGMRYLGRMQFRLESDEDTHRARLLVELLRSQPELRGEWEELEGILHLLFGERDDLTFREYDRVLAQLGPDGDLAELRQLLGEYPVPRINTAYIPWPESKRWKEKTRGLRIFGQRYTRPEDLLQQVLDMEIWPPSGLHIVAGLLGSRRAAELLTEEGVAPQLEVLKLPGPAADPLRSLSDGMLHCLRPLYDIHPDRPEFMARDPWQERLINSGLGAWAEMRHATLLYTKDAHAYSCASAMTDRFHGYVDPYPRFYERLNELVQRIDDVGSRVQLYAGIDADVRRVRESIASKAGVSVDAFSRAEAVRGIPYVSRYAFREAEVRLSRVVFEEFSSILTRLEAIAEKELRGEGQSIDDGFFLKGLGRRFKHLAFNHSNSDRAQTSMAIVSDVATEYFFKECLEAGVGRPLSIYVAVPDAGRHIICRGAVYTYYEFTQPVSRRLDDQEWREIARYPEESTRVPWIVSRPNLGLQRTLTREELGALFELRDHPGFRIASGKNKHPWRVDEYRNGAAAIGGARVDPKDLDLLLELAQQDTLNIGVRAYAYQELGRMAHMRQVAEFLKHEAARILDQGKAHMTRESHVRLYSSILGFGRVGPDALEALDRIEKRLTELYDNPVKKLVENALALMGAKRQPTVGPLPGYRAAIGRARQQIEAAPVSP
jgi:hypothetical protein